MQCRTLHELYTGESVPMTAADLALWEAYHAVEPWGVAQTHLGLGTIAAILANANKKKGSPAARATDVYPHLGSAEPKQAINETAIKAGLASRKKRQREQQKKWQPPSVN